MTAPAPPSVRSKPVRWARVAVDRVPTKWFVSAATGLFLIATAAFGGLAEVTIAPPAQLDAGETFSSPQVSITVNDVVLLDGLDELYIDLAPGERALAVLADVTNEWSEPQLATASVGGLREVLRLQAGGTILGTDELLAIARTDDPQTSPMLQPGVPAPLAFIWAVPAQTLAAGDPVDVEFFTQRLHTGTVTTAGQWWTDAARTAMMTVPAADREALVGVAAETKATAAQ